MNIENIVDNLKKLNKKTLVNSPESVALEEAIKMYNNKSDEFNKYLFEYWKNNFDSLCEYCDNKIECSEDCPKYENYGNVAYELNDTTKKEYILNFDATCMDEEFGTCSMMRDTVCNGCFENENVGFSWNGKIPTSYNTL